MIFRGFLPAGLALLGRLPALDASQFAAVRDDWQELLLDPARDLVEDLGARLVEQVSSGLVAEPKVNGSIAPIQRDLRFYPNGPRYKDHLLFRWWEGTPKKTAPTLFLRLDPNQIGFAAGVSFASANHWRTAVGRDPAGTAVRQLIEVILRGTTGTEIAGADLRRVPAPFPPDHPNADMLRHKSMFQLRWAEPLPKEVSTGGFTDYCASRLGRLAGLHRWLVAELNGANLDVC